MTEREFKQLLKPDEHQVFLFTCPATMPFHVARHPWLVVNNKGKVSRWEVLWKEEKSCPEHWGHLHKNFYSPTAGIPRYFFSEKYLWPNSRLIGSIGGDNARRMGECIENSPQSYPHRYRYSFAGPNSNTYVAWILRQFPAAQLRLPWNSFGKDYGNVN